MRAFLRNLAALIVALFMAAAFVAPTFAADPQVPALSGRVVDEANILSPEARAAIAEKTKALEDKSGIQLVVATVPSLQGLEIEPYANQLFRAWKLGETKKNNGVLFLIAPKERRVRIEVGYGLEGTLTDATSKIIIANAVAPRFKAGDFSGGVTRGVDDIITTLTADASDWQKPPPHPREVESSSLLDMVAPFLIILIFIFIFARLSRQQGGVGQAMGYILMNAAMMNSRGSRGGSYGGGSYDGGGFSGGGGSSGGGGASGSW
jgi:uncharacterized protein